MSDIEKEKFRQIGIDLINEYRVRGGLRPIDWLVIDTPEVNAFIRSIQLHEKTKKELQGVKQELADFRQEVSVSVKRVQIGFESVGDLYRFIIPESKRDPLLDVAKMMGYFNTAAEHWAGAVHVALDALGFEIREKNDDN